MSKLKKIEEHIDDVRDRLYDRQKHDFTPERHQLFEIDAESSALNVSKTSESVNKNPTDNSGAINNDGVDGIAEVNQVSSENKNTGQSFVPSVIKNDPNQLSVNTNFKKNKRRYRGKVLLISILFFVFMSVLSGIFFLFKGGSVSNDKLEVAINEPPFVRGGEESVFDVVISNNNAVALDSVVLTMNYPEGTRTVDDQSRILHEERIEVDEIEPGESRRIPVSVVLFGDSGEEKKIKATVEYRLRGSNGVFYKNSEPVSFVISSSPVVFSVDGIKKVSSGQYVDVALNIKSNSSVDLENIIVKAFYPNNINFESSNPKPVYGNNVWYIKKLSPNESKIINLKVKIEGFTKDVFSINFNLGLGEMAGKYDLKSILAKAKTDFSIESPFIETVISTQNYNSNDIDSYAIIKEGNTSNFNVVIKNTLPETIYDLTVEVIPKGDVIGLNSVVSNSGFYDSNSNSIIWAPSNNSSFSKVLPGEERQLSFKINPEKVKGSSSFEVFANVYARRVFENKVIEKLIGTAKARVKFHSTASIGGQVGRNIGFASDSGPIPPQVGKVTTYSISLVAEAGNNDISDVVVNTSLPIYVNWLDNYKVDGDVFYNEVSKTLEWKVGDISANSRKQFTFQVSVKPSVSQVGNVLILLNEQVMSAHENFANVGLSDVSKAITNDLSTEMGYFKGNGVVTY